MSDGLARPYDPFEIVPRYVWVECPLEDYAGFAIKVRSNLRNRDRKALLDLIEDASDESKRLAEAATKRLDALNESGDLTALAALLDEMNHLQDVNAERVPAAICAYVVDWNLDERDTETGVLVALKPPTELGLAAFEDLEQPMVNWIVGTVVNAYRSGKTLTDSSKTRAESAEPSSASDATTPVEPPKESRPAKSRPDRRSSPTPLVSTSTA